MPEPILINSIPDWAAFGVDDEVFFLVAAAFPQRRTQCSEIGVILPCVQKRIWVLDVSSLNRCIM
jgi:hypothetical protein